MEFHQDVVDVYNKMREFKWINTNLLSIDEVLHHYRMYDKAEQKFIETFKKVYPNETYYCNDCWESMKQ